MRREMTLKHAVRLLLRAHPAAPLLRQPQLSKACPGYHKPGQETVDFEKKIVAGWSHDGSMAVEIDCSLEIEHMLDCHHLRICGSEI